MLKSDSDLHDVKKKTDQSNFWTLSRSELIVWGLVMFGVPAALMASRVGDRGRQQDVVEIRSVGPVESGYQASAVPSLRLDLNTANEKQLELLPGIGPGRAQAIIERRNEKGPFRSIWELAEIQGFSKRMIERLESEIQVGAVNDLP